MDKDETKGITITEDDAYTVMRQEKQKLCKNANLVFKGMDQEEIFKNEGCIFHRRHGSAYCGKCSDEYNKG